LPRIFVNLAMVADTQSAEYQRLLLMAKKLYRFVTPIAVLAIGLGFWLWFGFGFSGGWLHAKTALVTLLAAYHFWCGRLLARCVAGKTPHGHVWFRWFNEVPVVALVAICILVVVKPSF
jgi:putative membrane protein